MKTRFINMHACSEMIFEMNTILTLVLLVLNVQFSTSFVVRNHLPWSKTHNVFEHSLRDSHRVRHRLFSVTKSQTAILDGSSFNALDLFLAAEGNSPSLIGNANKKHGVCSVVTAKLSNNERVVGILVEKHSSQNNDRLETVLIDDGVEVYKDSLAKIPNSVSDEDAISTTIASLAGIHCAAYNPIPVDNKIVKNIAGSTENFMSSKRESATIENKKAVVIGGGDFASFVAE